MAKIILPNEKTRNNHKHNNATNFYDSEIIKIFKENASTFYNKNCLQRTYKSDSIGKLIRQFLDFFKTFSTSKTEVLLLSKFIIVFKLVS